MVEAAKAANAEAAANASARKAAAEHAAATKAVALVHSQTNAEVAARNAIEVNASNVAHAEEAARVDARKAAAERAAASKLAEMARREAVAEAAAEKATKMQIPVGATYLEAAPMAESTYIGAVMPVMAGALVSITLMCLLLRPCYNGKASSSELQEPLMVVIV